jgi:uncharacterized membrane protein
MNRLVSILRRQKSVAVGVVAALLVLGAALYPLLPAQMSIHWNAAGQVDNTVGKPVAILAMPVIVVLMSVRFEMTGADADDRVVGSLAMVLLLVVQVMVFLVNLGLPVPIVPITMALALGLVALAVWFEVQ